MRAQSRPTPCDPVDSNPPNWTETDRVLEAFRGEFQGCLGGSLPARVSPRRACYLGALVTTPRLSLRRELLPPRRQQAPDSPAGGRLYSFGRSAMRGNPLRVSDGEGLLGLPQMLLFCWYF